MLEGGIKTTLILSCRMEKCGTEIGSLFLNYIKNTYLTSLR